MVRWNESWHGKGRIDLFWNGISVLDSSLVLLKALNHKYCDFHYKKPCILTKEVDHRASSLKKWTGETWKNSHDLTSKSLKKPFPTPLTTDSRPLVNALTITLIASFFQQQLRLRIHTSMWELRLWIQRRAKASSSWDSAASRRNSVKRNEMPWELQI